MTCSALVKFYRFQISTFLILTNSFTDFCIPLKIFTYFYRFQISVHLQLWLTNLQYTYDQLLINIVEHCTESNIKNLDSTFDLPESNKNIVTISSSV